MVLNPRLYGIATGAGWSDSFRLLYRILYVKPGKESGTKKSKCGYKIGAVKYCAYKYLTLTTLYFDCRVKTMPPATAAEGGGSAVDESLYSRQLYVMGHEAQVRHSILNQYSLKSAFFLARSRFIVLYKEYAGAV